MQAHYGVVRIIAEALLLRRLPLTCFTNSPQRTAISTNVRPWFVDPLHPQRDAMQCNTYF
jgi:hypothetical protein